MEILLIRHGEMDYGPRSEIDGSRLNDFATGTIDNPLSAKGRQQASRTAERLADMNLRNIVYSSDMFRAHETADIIAAGSGRSRHVIPELREINVGRLPALEGRATRKSRITRIPEKIRPAFEKPLGLALTFYYLRAWRKGQTLEAETPHGAFSRIRSGLEQMPGSHSENDRVAVVCHGYVIYTIASWAIRSETSLTGKIGSIWKLGPSVPHCSVTTIQYDGNTPQLIQFAKVL